MEVNKKHRAPWFVMAYSSVDGWEEYLLEDGTLFFYSNVNDKNCFPGVEIKHNDNLDNSISQDITTVIVSTEAVSLYVSEFNMEVLFYFFSDDQWLVSNDFMVLSTLVCKLGKSDNDINNVEPLMSYVFSALEAKMTSIPLDWRRYYNLSNSKKELASEKSAKLLVKYLCEVIEVRVGQSNNVSVVLSGGIDSGLVAFICKKELGLDVTAYTMGTGHGNEVSEAFELCQYLDIEHVPIFVKDVEIFSLIPKVISYLGSSNTEVVDIMLPFFSMLKKSISNCILLTGYGNDLLNGGLLKSLENKEAALVEMREGLVATSVTNELSTRYGLEFDVEVFHPYFSKKVIDHSLSIPIENKFYNNREKAFLREWYEKMVPSNIAWRSKIAVHHGSAIDRSISGSMKAFKMSGEITKDTFYKKVGRAVSAGKIDIDGDFQCVVDQMLNVVKKV